MTINLRTYGAGDHHWSSDSINFSSTANHAEALLYRVDISAAAPITVDIDEGVPMAAPPAGSGETPANSIDGMARTATLGMDVVVNCYSTNPGTFIVEDSSDGATWGNAKSFFTSGGYTLGFRFAPTLPRYRCRFVTVEGGYAKKVHVCSQLRNVGV